MARGAEAAQERAAVMRKRRCWYCRRVGRFGWRRRDRVFAPVCRNDEKCFARAAETRFRATGDLA